MRPLTKSFLVKQLYCLWFVLCFCTSCTKTKQEEVKTLFSLVNKKQTNIRFSNNVTENLYFNFLNYPYVYNGGGVAVGDINNDGLEDIYFTSNQNSNKLYLNKGDFAFKDITNSAQVVDDKGWSTGVTMIDINNDGWLDIYVCKSGALESHELRKNKLYINQKNNTFKESAVQYGLDFYGFSIQSYFFDMDNDGDLDMYLVNHRIDFRNNVTLDLERDKKIEDYGSDQLFRNDNGKFTNVTNAAGVANKAWGLSASIGDFNNDGWLDVFVANDFFHGDYLYINNKNGTFTDEALTYFNHISNNSMGSDFADINNDLQPDLIVLDMLAEDHIRSKNNMAAMNTNSFNMMVNSGYHHQYMSNVLQLNNGNGTFSEISQLAGIAKTDWSWSPLIADFDNDGFKDVFVTNGIKNDLSNQDFRDQMRQNIIARKKVSIEEAIAMMPSEKLQNYVYKNNGDLTLKNVSTLWGITQKINSNGAAYADLDNDGDLDLIVNNQSEIASIYKNNSINNYISFTLIGNKRNSNGIGAKVTVYTREKKQQKTNFVSRGYQSSVTNKVHFGLGDEAIIDSVKVVWQNGKEQTITQNKINSLNVLEYDNAKGKYKTKSKNIPLFVAIEPEDIGINYIQRENVFNDFDLQLLLPQKQSEFSTPLVVGDVNNDGLDDFFVGNAKDAEASLYIQKEDGTFKESNQKLFDIEKKYEDTDAKFFDIDNDNDLDLYITSGGYEIEENSPLLQDRLYVNDGRGNFKKVNNLPVILTNTKGIAITDYDNDGDIDVFIGSRVKNGKYPLSDTSYLLENRNGKFIDVTSKIIPEIAELHMVNDAIFSDYDNDGDKDLIVVGEWMPIIVFENQDKKFIKKEIALLKNINGWYQSISEADLNNDGNKDYIIGNWGDNNKFHPTKERPLHIYAGNFDENLSFDTALSKVSKTGNLIPVRGKQCSSEQTPFLNDKVKTYKDFASSTLFEIYGSDKLANATHYKAHNFKSIILMNNGQGEFTIETLPNQAQFGPTLSIEVQDINKDGYLDIFGVGNVYDAEVETIRYDASKGYILLGNEKGGYEYNSDTSYINNNEAKAIKKIEIGNTIHFIILNKNEPLKVLKLKKQNYK
jgi:enediyne biosynthesis protein E4